MSANGINSFMFYYVLSLEINYLMIKPQVTPICIVLADDHELLRDGFKAMLKKFKHVQVLGEASDGKQLLELVRKLEPQVVITDIKMPLLDGIESVKLIKEEFPTIKILALTNYDEESLIIDMIQAGADGYLLKSASKKEILDAIFTILSGKIYYCTTTSQKLLNHFNDNPICNARKEKDIKFTKRELEVMKLICRGMTNKEVGNELGISARTVESHKESIQEKIGGKSAVTIALFASRNGYI
jgi:DNA-binding NarL/FixJ family response regulator